MTRVKIETPGAKVEIETDDQPYDEVAAKALELFKDAGGWPQDKGRAFGFSVQQEARPRREIVRLGSTQPNIRNGEEAAEHG